MGHYSIPNNDLLSFNSFNIKSVIFSRIGAAVRAREHTAPYAPSLIHLLPLPGLQEGHYQPNNLFENVKT